MIPEQSYLFSVEFCILEIIAGNGFVSGLCVALPSSLCSLKTLTNADGFRDEAVTIKLGNDHGHHFNISLKWSHNSKTSIAQLSPRCGVGCSSRAHYFPLG